MRKETFGKTCAKCGSPDALQIHHISYIPEITQILCVSCHQKHHGHGVGKNRDGTHVKRKNIVITDDQEDWLRDNCVSLSRFVQKRIDEAMTKPCSNTMRGESQ